MRKNRVLIISDLFPREKTDIRGIYILDYIAAVEREYAITVLNPAYDNPREHAGEIVPDSYILRRTRAGTKRNKGLIKVFGYFWLFLVSIIKGMNTRPIQLIHAHGVIIPGIIGVVLSKLCRVPLIVTEHTGPYSVVSSKPALRMIAQWVMNNATHRVAVSEHLRAEIQQVHGYHLPVSVIGNPVKTDVFYDRSIERNNIILYVGRIDREKGLYESLAALEKLSTQWSAWSYEIIGDGPFRPHLEIALRNEFASIAQRVTMHGWKAREEVAEIMSKAAFLLHLSKHESFGITVVEAMACGLPVVAGANSGMLDTVTPDTGILIDVSNEERVCDALSYMLDNYKSYDRDRIQQYAHATFGYEAFRKSLLAVYDEVLS